MRPLQISYILCALLSAGPLACASQASGESTASSGSAALGAPGVPNAADTSCNVFLHDIAPASDTAAAISGHVDISNEALLESDQAYVLYQSGSDPSWYSAPTIPAVGAGTGFARVSFNLTSPAWTSGQPLPTIQVIPYLITIAGTHLYDHNVYSNQNYVLDAADSWTIGYNGDYCYEPPAPGTGTVTFATGWTESTSGSLVEGGKLVVSYDLSRMPQCEGKTTDGVEAWATTANALFLPGGQVLSGAVNGGFDTVTSSWTSLIFERDIPQDATSVQLWFETSGEGCTTGWDSDYGNNYSYAISPVSY